jgi:hypothetical protein
VVEFLNESTLRLYDPHLTLLSTNDTDYESKIQLEIHNYNPISDDFILSLGECDEIGQFTILNTCTFSKYL